MLPAAVGCENEATVKNRNGIRLMKEKKEEEKEWGCGFVFSSNNNVFNCGPY